MTLKNGFEFCFSVFVHFEKQIWLSFFVLASLWKTELISFLGSLFLKNRFEFLVPGNLPGSKNGVIMNWKAPQYLGHPRCGVQELQMTDALIRFSQSRKNDIRNSNLFFNNKPCKNVKRKSNPSLKVRKKRKPNIKSVFSRVNEKRVTRKGTRIGQMPLPYSSDVNNANDIHPKIGWRRYEHRTHKRTRGSWILCSVSRVRPQNNAFSVLHYVIKVTLHFYMFHRFEIFKVAPN